MKTKAMKSIRTQMLETVVSESLAADAVDREAGVIRGVKILGRVSKNGRVYSDKAMDDGVRIYEGLKVNVDHPDKSRPKAERGFLEGFGELRGVTRKDDGVYGDLHFLKSHPAASPVCESAERFPKQFGLSHNAEGETVRRDGQTVVESLTSAVSVDIVGRPATNEGIFESVDADKGATVVKTSIRKLVESGKCLIYKAKHLVEMEGGDAALMDTPYDMPMSDGGTEVEANPDEAIASAFEQAVAAVVKDESLDVAAKLARIEEILTAHETLKSGAAAPAETPAADVPVAESVVLESIKGLRSLIESQSSKNAELAARLTLMESRREAKPERVKALVEAKDDAHRMLLLESWPLIAGPAKPATSRPLMESAGASKPAGDAKGFMQRIKSSGHI